MRRQSLAQLAVHLDTLAAQELGDLHVAAHLIVSNAVSADMNGTRRPCCRSKRRATRTGRVETCRPIDVKRTGCRREHRIDAEPIPARQPRPVVLEGGRLSGPTRPRPERTYGNGFAVHLHEDQDLTFHVQAPRIRAVPYECAAAVAAVVPLRGSVRVDRERRPRLLPVGPPSPTRRGPMRGRLFLRQRGRLPAASAPPVARQRHYSNDSSEPQRAFAIARERMKQVVP